MTDNLSPEDRRKTMRAVKSKGTTPERRFQSLLAGLGVSGWKRHYEEAPGRPDFAFPIQKVAVFIDGCFWHGCPVCDRPLPQSNQEYWKRKIERNVTRAELHDSELNREGWQVIHIWEHQLKKNTWSETVNWLKQEHLDKLAA